MEKDRRRHAGVNGERSLTGLRESAEAEECARRDSSCVKESSSRTISEA